MAGCGREVGSKTVIASKGNASEKVLNVDSPPKAGLYIHSSTKDEDIRGILLSHTPIGAEATNVLEFVVDELRPERGAISYFKYVDAVETGRTNRLDVVRVNPSPPAILPEGTNWTQPRNIYAVITSYPDGKFVCKVSADWLFDENDRLVELRVERDHSP